MKDSDQHFEERLKELVPTPASPQLRSRIAHSLDEKPSSPIKFRRSRKAAFGIGLAAAASVAIAFGVVFLKPDIPSAEPSLTVGQEQILVGVSEPNFVEVAGADPMWEIEVQILNRAIIDTPEGGRETILVPEQRRVFVPAVYQ